ncbi:hypothetical protein J5J10_08735 [Ciceribacter sp. L1K23]|uniref:hypothetical protein n=1 Tax=Ciceribacter sp. L1K23 TaxID=2820276 RepID=UPI001B819184|nr:hypothetical protein [Ciceribacter sp. L1K23]MBR0555765.1 hypothetical protein [Ciceribacter sp. L1K23]
MQKLDLFIICPIGKQHHMNRGHSIRVKEMLLDPAIRCLEEKENVRVSAEIDNYDLSARDIVQGIVGKIIRYDFVVALIYENNPNVYYELGVAHSAGRDVVILFETDSERESLPFDITGRSVIQYERGPFESWRDGRQRSELDAVIDKVYQALAASLKNKTQPRTAFNSEHWDALGSRHSKYILHERFTQSLPYNDVKSMEFYDSATSYMALMGISLHQLTSAGENWKLPDGRSVSFLKLLELQALKKGLTIDIFVMHPDNPALPGMLKGFIEDSDDPDMQLQMVQSEIEAASTQWRFLIDRVQRRGGPGRVRLLRLKRGIPYNRLSLTDHALIATPYFYHNVTNGTGPALQVTQETSLYKLVRSDLEFLQNSPSTEIFASQPPDDVLPGA